jgi:hypothetical protein
MAEAVSLLMLEFLAWVASRRRSYDDAAQAWRSTCPRHTEWEDAFIDGLVQVENGGGPERCAVTLTARGRGLLEAHGDAPPSTEYGTEGHAEQPTRGRSR